MVRVDVPTDDVVVLGANLCSCGVGDSKGEIEIKA